MGKNNKHRGTGFWFLIIVSIILCIFYLAGQTFSLINYEKTVEWGLQESVEEITSIGIPWIKGFAFADTVIYIPLLLAGIIGLVKRKTWGYFCLFGSLAISVYWPLVNLFAVYAGKDVMPLHPDKYLSYSILLPLISIYGLWGMVYLYKNRNLYK